MKNESLLIHGGIDVDAYTGAVSVPIYQTSTFKQQELGVNKGYEYSRTGNPTRAALEKLIAELEGGEKGLAFSSGMAAVTAVATLFKNSDKLLICDNLYGGTFRVLDKIFKNFGIDYEIVDTTDENNIKEKITDNVRAIFIETPTNPLMAITDIRKVSAIAKEYNILTIVDNTFMTPYLQRPIELGADIVVHSGTKYLGGHSDLVAGLVAVKDSTLAEKLHFIQNATGGILGPFDSWLLIRGIRTLAVRMDRHIENSNYIAEYLKNNAAIDKVYYPGLKEHPGYELHKSQANGPGGMISFTLKKEIEVNRFLKSLKIIALAESLGGVESLICQPSSMTHGSIPYEIRQRVGITENLIRLSVGIENKEDLAEDIENAIKSAGNQVKLV